MRLFFGEMFAAFSPVVGSGAAGFEGRHFLSDETSDNSGQSVAASANGHLRDASGVFVVISFWIGDKVDRTFFADCNLVFFRHFDYVFFGSGTAEKAIKFRFVRGKDPVGLWFDLQNFWNQAFGVNDYGDGNVC